MRLLLILLLLVVAGCKREPPEPRHVRGVISMKGVREGWVSHSVPVGHPQLLSDPEGRLVIRAEDKGRFEDLHGDEWKVDNGTWILVPLDWVHGGRYIELVQVEGP